VRKGIKRIGNKLGIPDDELFYSPYEEATPKDTSTKIPENLKDRPYASFGK